MAHDSAEQLLAIFPADSGEARTIRQLTGYREEYEALQRELATPPPGWFTFGHHVNDPEKRRLEFWGDQAGAPPLGATGAELTLTASGAPAAGPGYPFSADAPCETPNVRGALAQRCII